MLVFVWDSSYSLNGCGWIKSQLEASCSTPTDAIDGVLVGGSTAVQTPVVHLTAANVVNENFKQITQDPSLSSRSDTEGNLTPIGYRGHAGQW